MARMPIINMRIVPDGATVWLALSMDPVEVLGVFADENEAAAACTDTYDVCGPLRFGRAVLSQEKWEGAYYPMGKEKTE